jgi:hypothetical protein
MFDLNHQINKKRRTASKYHFVFPSNSLATFLERIATVEHELPTELEGEGGYSNFVDFKAVYHVPKICWDLI